MLKLIIFLRSKNGLYIIYNIIIIIHAWRTSDTVYWRPGGGFCLNCDAPLPAAELRRPATCRESHSQTMDFRRDRGDFLLTTICRMHPLWPVCDNPLLGSQPIGLFWNLSSVLLSIFEFVLSTIEPLKVSFIAQPYVPYGYVHIYI